MDKKKLLRKIRNKKNNMNILVVLGLENYFKDWRGEKKELSCFGCMQKKNMPEL